MARHFLGLYLMIVLTLAAASWAQDKLLQAYGTQDTADDRLVSVALSAADSRLQNMPSTEWQRAISDMTARTGGDFELFSIKDLTGAEMLRKLEHEKIAYMQAGGESWALKQVDGGHVLALRSAASEAQRGPLEWAITLMFYALIALVIMIWIWPLRRDLGVLEKAAARFGNKNWAFDAPIKPASQIYPLAETFRKMAVRIDGLVASHKDLSNAVSHEIKTPLSRMLFEIELAERAQVKDVVRASLDNIKSDIVAIDNLVSATLSYAVLERADMSLNLHVHNFTTLMPGIADYVRQDARPDIAMGVYLQGDTDHVLCDVHLMETAVKNMLYNAARYARGEVRVTFTAQNGVNQLLVDDDGPGIPEKDRQRVFDSFVRLEPVGDKKGFGLGLAIVRRIIEWHGGTVIIQESPLGGARVAAAWSAICST